MRSPVSVGQTLGIGAALALLAGCSGSGNNSVPLLSAAQSANVQASQLQPAERTCAANTNAADVPFPGVPLGSDATFAVLGGSTVTSTGPTVLTGNLGLYPGTSITGFGPGVVHGTIHAGDPIAAEAQHDLEIAFKNAMSRRNPGNLPADIGGMTINPGLYQPTASVTISGNVTLDGHNKPNSVFIFQIPSTLTTNVNSSVTLINKARACNVFWAVGSSATLDTASMFSGIIFAFSSVSLGTGAQVQGRVLAQNGAVTLLSNIVTEPGP